LFFESLERIYTEYACVYKARGVARSRVD
jgi:hypothetical protein